MTDAVEEGRAREIARRAQHPSVRAFRDQENRPRGLNAQLANRQALRANQHKKRVVCRHCALEIGASLYPGHLEDAHDDTSDLHQCPDCGKGFRPIGLCNVHLASHLEASLKPLKCTEPDCETRFATSQARDKHVISIHKPEQKKELWHPCLEPECTDRFFVSALALKNHMEMHKPLEQRRGPSCAPSAHQT